MLAQISLVLFQELHSDGIEKALDQVNFPHFAQTLATFKRTEAKHSSQLNTVDQKIRCKCSFSMHCVCISCALVVFRVYDTDNDGFISKDDLIHVGYVTIDFLMSLTTIS